VKNFKLAKVSCVLLKKVSKSLKKAIFKIWFNGENDLMRN
jgi:hypothetical protein